MANEKRLIDANALKANFVVVGEFAEDLWHTGTIRIAIDNAPTVDAVEVVHGRWIIPTIINGRSFKIPHCSVCGEVPCGVSENTKYCAICGARMDLEEN